MKHVKYLESWLVDSQNDCSVRASQSIEIGQQLKRGRSIKTCNQYLLCLAVLASVSYSPDVGSSRNIMLGRLMSCKATHNLLFCPPLSPGPTLPPTGVLATALSPVCSIEHAVS